MKRVFLRGQPDVASSFSFIVMARQNALACFEIQQTMNDGGIVSQALLLHRSIFEARWQEKAEGKEQKI